MRTLARCLQIFVCFFLILRPPQAQAQLSVALDYATFRYDTSKVYTEIYYSIPTSELKFFETASGAKQAVVLVRLNITKDGVSWREEAWRMEKTTADTAGREGSRMVDILRYLMEPGRYHVSIHVEDLNDAKNFQHVEKELEVVSFSSHQLDFSDILFAGSIRKSSPDSSSNFYKNGMEIIPLPGAVYGKASPLLYYYLEVYNLAAAVDGEVYTTRCQITNDDGQPAKMKPREQTKKKLDSMIEVGALNVASLPSGVYQFQIGILDGRNEILQSAVKKFYVYNPEVAGANASVSESVEAAAYTSEFAVMTEKQLDAEFETAKYIVSEDERKAYKSLKTREGKLRFLHEFWWQRDPTPATPVNEYRNEYRRRMEYANENFRSYTRAGWKTDRGRAYILYGPPSDIERFPNNPLSYSYEIWRYDDIEGGVIFVFADLQEFGEYMQLHSSKRGEPANEEWEEKIKKL